MLNGQERGQGSSVIRKKKPPSQTAITDFMASLHCVVCGAEERLNNNRRHDMTAVSTSSFVCTSCSLDPGAVLSALHARMDAVDAKAAQLKELCMVCTGGVYPSQYATSMFDFSSSVGVSQSSGSSGVGGGDTNSSEDKRQAGRGFMNMDGCTALDCPVQFSRCQYLSRCEDVRVSLAHITTEGDGRGVRTGAGAGGSGGNSARRSSSSSSSSSSVHYYEDLTW
jgi:hypothetical protein